MPLTRRICLLRQTYSAKYYASALASFEEQAWRKKRQRNESSLLRILGILESNLSNLVPDSKLDLNVVSHEDSLAIGVESSHALRLQVFSDDPW